MDVVRSELASDAMSQGDRERQHRAREGLSFREAFYAQVDSQPDAPALIWNRELTTYRELYELAEKAGAQFAQLDLGPDEPVGVLGKKSPATVALVLACLLDGRRFLLPSPAFADRMLRQLFAQARCRYVLVPDGEPQVNPPTADGGPLLRVAEQDDDVSFMLTTSGSTGLPKIVPLEQSGVDRFIRWAGEKFNLGPGRTVLNYAPLNFDLCLLDIWSTLAHGGTVVMVDPDQAVNGFHLLDVLQRNEVHVVQAVPMFYGLLHYAAVVKDRVFDDVEHVMFTGDAMPDCTLVALPGLFPKAKLYNIYGCTETNDSFIYEVDRDAVDGAEEGTIGPLSIGEPLPGVHAEIVDEHGRVIDGPGLGELYVSTPFQTTGYLDRKRHRGRFVAHPDGLDERRYFRTGDLVRRDHSGQFFLVGRSDFQIKVRGTAINLAEVEQALLEHQDVVEAAVIAQPDSLAGKKLVSIVQRKEGSGLTSLALRKHCVERLPRAAVPSTLRVSDDPLPKTVTGKVDRKAIEVSSVLSRAEGKVS